MFLKECTYFFTFNAHICQVIYTIVYIQHTISKKNGTTFCTSNVYNF